MQQCVRIYVIAVCLLSVMQLNAQTTYQRKSIDIPGMTVFYTSHITTFDGGTMALNQCADANGQLHAIMVKTSVSGNIQWTRSFGPFNSECKNVVQLADSGYFFCCAVPNTFNLWYDIVKTDANGNIVYMKRISTPNPQMVVGSPGHALAKNDGGVYIAGNVVDLNVQQNRWHLFELDANGNVLLSTIYDINMNKSGCKDIDTCSNGDIVIIGQGIDVSMGNFNPVILKVNPAGTIIWYKQYVTNPLDVVFTSMEINASDELLIAGYSYNSSSFNYEAVYMKFDSSGNVLHSFRYYHPSYALQPEEIARAENNHVVMIGKYFFIKIDSAGLPIASRHYWQDEFFSFDTLPGPVYTMMGNNGLNSTATYMTTDVHGLSCEGIGFTLTKVGFTSTVLNLTGMNPLPLTDSVIVYSPPPFTVHFQEECSIMLGAEDPVQPATQIFPNPAENLLTVESAESILIAELYDVHGQRVWASSPASIHFTIDVSKLSSGIYFLVTTSADGTSTQKVSIHH